MKQKNRIDKRGVESAFQSAGLSDIFSVEPSSYVSKRDPDGKPTLSKYQYKKLNGSDMGLALLAAMKGS